jgi:hypothetical protein
MTCQNDNGTSDSNMELLFTIIRPSKVKESMKAISSRTKKPSGSLKFGMKKLERTFTCSRSILLETLPFLYSAQLGLKFWSTVSLKIQSFTSCTSTRGPVEHNQNTKFVFVFMNEVSLSSKNYYVLDCL